MKCLNYEHLGHMIKFYPKPIKVRQYLQEGDLLPKQVWPNLISFKSKMGTHMVFYLLDLGTTHSFVKPSVVKWLKCSTKKVVKPIKVQLA